MSLASAGATGSTSRCRPASRSTRCLAARIFYWIEAQAPEKASGFAKAAYRKYWLEGSSTADVDVAVGVAATLGFDRARVAAGMQDPAIKLKLARENEQAIANGVFGSPFIIVDGEPFWGGDRLDCRRGAVGGLQLMSRTISGGRLIALVCAAQVLVQIGAFFWPALLPEMIPRWSLTNSEAGWITAAFYGAYIFAVPVLVTLTDRIDAKRVYLSGVGSRSRDTAVRPVADGFWSALAARAFTGVGWAGTYMTGLKLLADIVDGKLLSRAATGHAASIGISGALSFLRRAARGASADGASPCAGRAGAGAAWPA